ncbi:MAG: bis(5'-nucleosyl)-tetraphosphatase (symmetrical) YqeK [Eubacterium sp.]
MYNKEEYISIIRSRLSDYRFYHSMCVAESAKMLAEKYGADEEKAEIAGILHDAMKENTKKEQLQVIEKANMKMTPLEKSQKKFYHQISGAAFAKTELGIDDGEILNAIRYHTTARADMTLMEQIIYLADFISADRSYDDVDVMRQKAQTDKDDAMLYATAYTIKDVVSKGKVLHPDTVNAYNWLINSVKKEKESE